MFDTSTRLPGLSKPWLDRSRSFRRFDGVRHRRCHPLRLRQSVLPLPCYFIIAAGSVSMTGPGATARIQTAI